ncbi:MAG: hypothetical protein KDB27_05030 [Planctomycetales bacterium]|nr:hypothetical protein [Planctomycetales bacterium]
MTDERRSDILMYVISDNGRERTLLSLMPLDDGFERGIPSEAILGELAEGAVAVSEACFTPNVAFIKFMHESIATHVQSCPSLIDRAKRLGAGKLPLLDGRVPDGQKQVNAADVIGLLDVEAERIVRYTANMQHKIVYDDQVMKLEPFLLERLIGDILRQDPLD